MDVSAGVVKFDCLSTDDDARYSRAGIPVRKGLSRSICPDHYFASNIEESVAWGEQETVDMLLTADVVVITEGDVVSQAEREVFSARVHQANPRARILPVNGLNGQGAFGLARLLRDEAPEQAQVTGSRLRYPMPSAVCSYCLDEQRIGAEHQIGNVTALDLTTAGGDR
jgi:Ni2+-binding GTPase involved in maturation of urease and hydrogenase